MTKKGKKKPVKAEKAKDGFAFKHLFNVREFQNAPSLNGRRPIESLTLEEFGIRVSNFGGDSMKVMYSFVKSIALTTATVVLMQLLFKSHWSFDAAPDWYLCFNYVALLISFVVLMITYEAPMFGALFVYQSPPWWTTLLPALFAACEFLVFAILSPTFFTGSLEPKITLSESGILFRWYVVNMTYHILISWFCFRAVSHFTTNIKEDLDDEIRPVFASYRDDVERERVASFIGAIVLLVGCLINAMLPEDSSWAMILNGLLLTVLLCMVLHSFIDQHSKRERVMQAYRDSVRRKLQKHTTP